MSTAIKYVYHAEYLACELKPAEKKRICLDVVNYNCGTVCGFALVIMDSIDYPLHAGLSRKILKNR